MFRSYNFAHPAIGPQEAAGRALAAAGRASKAPGRALEAVGGLGESRG